MRLFEGALDKGGHMHTWLYRLGSDANISTDKIGQKAATLDNLMRAGFPIPRAVCVTTQAFQSTIAPLAKRINAIQAGHDLSAAANGIAALLEELTLSSDLLDALSSALDSLGGGPFAVRSSATLEDLPEMSFAGQYHTELGASSAQDVASAILACWRSFYSHNALAARARLNPLHEGDRGMAVLIQPLLDAECSGVCFTVDPVRQRPEVIMVTAAYGLGIGVVNGAAPADTMRLRRMDFSFEQAIITEKDSCIRSDPTGGVQRVAVPDEQRRIACLPDDWLRRVAQFGLAAEQHLGNPQDVEWTIADQQVWLLQSRPITTLSEGERRAVSFPIEWVNEQERHKHWWLISRADTALLPAELEFRKASSQGGQAAVMLGGGAKTRWVKDVNGRMYMAMADSPLSAGDQRIRHAALMDLLDRLQEQDVTMWEHFGPEVVRATEHLAAFDERSADGPALANHLEDALAAARRHWMIHTLMPRHGKLDSLLDVYRQVTGKGPTEAEQDVPFLLQGAETVQTRLIEWLYALAESALAHPAVGACIQSDALDRYRALSQMPEAAAFLKQFEQVMATYGARVCVSRRGNDGDYDIELPLPWREAPEHVLGMVAAYMALVKDKAHVPPQDARADALRADAVWVDEICALTADPALAQAFRHQLEYARRGAAGLDDHNHYIDQVSEGQYSQAVIYAGRWLAARGDVRHPYDAFWLHEAELTAALRASDRQDFTTTLAERRAQFNQQRNAYAPAHIGLPDAHLPQRQDTKPHHSDAVTRELTPTATGNRLVGQAASAGKRSGRARIVPQGAALPDIAPGDVLVAAHAGPEWTPVFAVLAGIVLDGSYPGDHAGITAREFGVPAVFCTGSATQRIPEGAWVTVDGDVDSVTWS
jgi:pyruvate,water dikinase